VIRSRFAARFVITNDLGDIPQSDGQGEGRAGRAGKRRAIARSGHNEIPAVASGWIRISLPHAIKPGTHYLKALNAHGGRRAAGRPIPDWPNPSCYSSFEAGPLAAN
jgi:hypothetical protein